MTVMAKAPRRILDIIRRQTLFCATNETRLLNLGAGEMEGPKEAASLSPLAKGVGEWPPL